MPLGKVNPVKGWILAVSTNVSFSISGLCFSHLYKLCNITPSFDAYVKVHCYASSCHCTMILKFKTRAIEMTNIIRDNVHQHYKIFD